MNVIYINLTQVNASYFLLVMRNATCMNDVRNTLRLPKALGGKVKEDQDEPSITIQREMKEYQKLESYWLITTSVKS